MNAPIPVLMVHNRYIQRGGEDVVFEADLELLRSRGHTVTVYEDSNARLESMSRPRAAARAIHSPESARAVAALIRRCRPAVMHVHNLFPAISSSVIDAAARAKVPVVQNLSNYRCLCPNALLLRDGRICEDCIKRRCAWPAVRHACYRGSRAASAVAAAVAFRQRRRERSERRPAFYLTMSMFARAKFIEGGFDPARVVVRANFLGTDPGPGAETRAGAVFAGMLHPWKGVDTLLRAWRALPAPEPLRIVGAGPEEAALRRIAAGDARIRFMGAMSLNDLFGCIRAARFLIFPSIVYETFGRTLIEAFACATPVIASRLGAAREIVNAGLTGLRFNPGDAADLAAKIGWALAHPESMRRMGRAARVRYEEAYTSDVAYRRLMEIYGMAIRAGLQTQRGR